MYFYITFFFVTNCLYKEHDDTGRTAGQIGVRGGTALSPALSEEQHSEFS